MEIKNHHHKVDFWKEDKNFFLLNSAVCSVKGTKSSRRTLSVGALARREIHAVSILKDLNIFFPWTRNEKNGSSNRRLAPTGPKATEVEKKKTKCLIGTIFWITNRGNFFVPTLDNGQKCKGFIRKEK